MVSDGLCVAQHRLLQHVLPHVAGWRSASATSWATASPARPRRGSARTSCSATKVMVPMDGPGAGGRRAARVAAPSRSRAPSQRDSEFDELQDPEELRAAAARQEPATTWAPSPCSCSCAGCSCSRCWSSAVAAVDLLRRATAPWRSSPACSPPWSSALVLRGARRAAVIGFRRLSPKFVLDLRPVLLAARAAVEAAGITLALFAGTPFRAADLAAAGRADRPAGVRRRLLDPGEDAGRPSATTSCSTRAA